MENHSTIYISCPQCGKLGLLVERQGRYFCAGCMFDYTALKDDRGRLDDVLIETMKQKGFGPIFASALHQRVTLATPIDANNYIQQLAQKNNIDLYQGHGLFVKIIDWLLRLFKR
jgi:hypothetical protein